MSPQRRCQYPFDSVLQDPPQPTIVTHPCRPFPRVPPALSQNQTPGCRHSLAGPEEDPLLQQHRNEDPGKLFNVQALDQGLERELCVWKAIAGGGLGGEQAVLNGKENLGLARDGQGDGDQVGYG